MKNFLVREFLFVEINLDIWLVSKKSRWKLTDLLYRMPKYQKILIIIIVPRYNACTPVYDTIVKYLCGSLWINHCYEITYRSRYLPNEHRSAAYVWSWDLLGRRGGKGSKKLVQVLLSWINFRCCRDTSFGRDLSSLASRENQSSLRNTITCINFAFLIWTWVAILIVQLFVRNKKRNFDRPNVAAAQ